MSNALTPAPSAPVLNRRTATWMRAGAAYVIVASLAAVALIPILWLGVVSVMPSESLVRLEPTTFRPTLAHYREILTGPDAPLLGAFLNSITVAVVSTAVSVIAAAFGAYALARLRPRGHKLLGAAMLATRLLPPIALVVPLYIVANQVGMLDTRIALILPYIALSVPLATWILHSFFVDLPPDLEEAAMVDGCNRFTAFLWVTLPLAGPALAAAAVMSFVLAWNDMLLALPLTLQDAVTLPVFASQVRTDLGIAWGRLGAITMVMVIPIALFTYVAQRWIISGITSGATKG